MRRGTFIPAFAFALLCAGGALAGPSGDTYIIQWENDRIANTDRDYTNGFRLSWASTS